MFLQEPLFENANDVKVSPFGTMQFILIRIPVDRLHFDLIHPGGIRCNFCPLARYPAFVPIESDFGSLNRLSEIITDGSAKRPAIEPVINRHGRFRIKNRNFVSIGVD
jgi:hypothetical protein